MATLSTAEPKKILKEDINYLEYPLWILNDRSKVTTWVLQKEKGTYQMSSPQGLPTHIDRLILYFLLYKLYTNHNFASHELVTTRYEIVKNVFCEKKVGGKAKFERVIKSLKKWETTSISFEGIFYEGDAHTIRFFHVLDDVVLNTENNSLYIRFNQQYIQQLRESKFYKYIDFTQYRRLTKAVSARLYEILIKSFKDRTTWRISIQQLADKLTVEKRAHAQTHYPSDILVKLKPAIQEINEKTELTISLHYNKEHSLCVFENRGTRSEAALEDQKGIKQPLAKDYTPAHPLVQSIISKGISTEKAQLLVKTYSAEKITHALGLLQQDRDSIKNSAAWLTKALKENWGAEHLEARKRKADNARKRTEQEKHKQRLEQLKIEHSAYTDAKTLELFTVLPAKVAHSYDKQFATWFKQKQKNNPFVAPYDIERLVYLKEALLDDEDLNFECWSKKQLSC